MPCQEVYCRERVAVTQPGVYQSALRDDVHIPNQLSVVPVDDFEPIAGGLMLGLTTVALPHYELGKWG